MSIVGTTFRYDGIPSQPMGLFFGCINTSPGDTPLGGEWEYTKFRNAHNSVTTIVDSDLSENLEFSAEVISEAPLSPLQQRRICRWLFDRPNYRELRIQSPEYYGLHFDCILKKAQPILVGGNCFGYQFDVECNAPWAWEDSQYLTYRPKSGEEICIQNSSDNPDYTKPSIKLVTGSAEGIIRIINQTDNNQTVQFDPAPKNCTIVLDELGQVSSPKGSLNLQGYNGGLLRLLPGENTLRIYGELTEFSLSYQNARRVAI